ncbi:aspartyl protease family protein [Sphingomonas abietis]|uniref:Aspartyl protease family protein n=1 Tax=Sphingomonas abietis TaxID=3012344 RepID=A0ABY7NML3_9SPHN|nr:aspartyl protease family protein [Sphingomonas abietis]WBO22472.1 aspartyl protease family protein [Sphingomonas abietis]
MSIGMIVALGAMLQTAAPALPAPPVTTMSATTTPADATTVPGDPASTAVKLREVDARMTVPVLINGQGPFRFIVDSGATRTVISSRLAAQLALPAAGTVPLHSIGGESEVPAARIASLYVGTLPAKEIVAPILDETNLGAAGILGIDTLKGKKVVIDLLHHSMSVEPADKMFRAPIDNEIVVTARSRFGQLVLADADAAGQRIYAIVDTGSMVTLGNLALMDRLVRKKKATPQQTVITDVTGREIVATYAPISDLRLGPWHMSNVVIAFDDAHAFARFGVANKPAMLLGMDMMQAFSRVSIDFARRKVRLLRRGENDGTTVRLDPAG